MLTLKSAPEVAKDLAGRVRERRLHERWTQAELARRAGLKTPTYVLFERTGRISVIRLIKVLEIFRLADEFDQIAREKNLVEMTMEEFMRPRRQRGRRQTK